MDLNKPGAGRKLINQTKLSTGSRQRDWTRQRNLNTFRQSGGRPPKPNGR